MTTIDLAEGSRRAEELTARMREVRDKELAAAGNCQDARYIAARLRKLLRMLHDDRFLAHTMGEAITNDAREVFRLAVVAVDRSIEADTARRELERLDAAKGEPKP